MLYYIEYFISFSFHFFKATCREFYNETDPSLVLKSPGFDTGSYPNNIKCTWTIESPEQAAGITIRFKYFDLEPTKRCSKYDYVAVYAQGNGETQWKKVNVTFYGISKYHLYLKSHGRR